MLDATTTAAAGGLQGQRREVSDFLTSRRGRVTPAQVGLPERAGVRRVPGLRREEVALLAGVSVEYYTRLERGHLRGVSEEVLHALAEALRLDDAERGHLADLARAASGAAGTSASARRRRASTSGPASVRPELLRLLHAITDAPAYLRNARRDVLAANALGRALYSELYDDALERSAGSAGGGEPAVNVARFVFLSPRARTFFPSWEGTARDAVATLRTEAGRNPFDRALSDLVGELTTRSEVFARMWADHDVGHHRVGRKDVHHPVVGDLHLAFEALELPADPGLALVAYTAEPGSSSADGLRLLASWAATATDETTSTLPSDS